MAMHPESSSDPYRLTEEVNRRSFNQIPAVELYSQPEFTDNITNNQINGFWDSVGTGLTMESGAGSSGAMAVYDRYKYGSAPEDVDPNFNPYAYMQEQGDYTANIWTTIENSEQPEDSITYERLINAKSPFDADKAVRHWMRRKQLNEAADEHGFGTFLGSLAGFVPDALILTLIGSPALAVPATAARIAQMAALSQKIQRAVTIERSTLAATRLPAAAKIGAAGAAWGLGETGLYELNRVVTNDEYLFNAVGGLVLGAALGGIFPRVIGRAHVNESGELLHPLRPHDDAAILAAKGESENGGGLSAADVDAIKAANDAEQNVRLELPASPFSPIANSLQRWGGIIGTGKFATTPKTFIAQLGNAVLLFGRKHAALSRYTDDNYNIFGRIARGVYLHKNELRGGAGVRTAADEAQYYGQMASQWVDENDRLFMDKFFNKVKHLYGQTEKFGPGHEILNRGRRWLDIRQMPQKAEILAVAQYFRRRRAIDAENAKMADRMASKNPDANPEDFMIPRPTDEQIIDLMPGLKSVEDKEVIDAAMELAEEYADRYDARYELMEKENVDAGMLKPEQVIKHYFPQTYNVKQAQMDPMGFDHMIHQNFVNEPSIDWINATFAREMKDGPDGNKIPDGTPLEEGEDLADLAARNPELYKEIRDVWADKVRQSELDNLELNIDAITAKIDDSQLESAAQLEERYAARMEQHDKALAKFNEALRIGDEAYETTKSPDWSTKRDAIKENAMKRNIQRAADEARLVEVRAAFDASDRRTMLKLEMTRKTKSRKKSSKLMKQLQKKTNKERDLHASATIAQAVEDIRNSITSGSQAHTGSLPRDRMTTGNSRYMQRQINWKQHAFTPEGKKFLNQNVELGDNLYVHTAMRQVAMKKTLFKYMESLDQSGRTYDKDSDMLATIRGYMTSQAAIARSNATSPREVNLINKVMTRSLDTFDAMLKDYNHSHMQDVNDNTVLEIIKGTNALQMLGTLGISQITDPIAATASLPGGYGAKWWGNVFNPFRSQVRTANNLIKQVEGLPEQERLVFLLQGANAKGTSRFDNMVNPESIGEILYNHYGEENVGVAGAMRIVVREAGHLQNWATLAPLMNKMTQGNAGMLQAKAMHKYITDYDSFSAMDKENFARLGLGKRQVAMMKKLMDDPSMVQKLDDGTPEGLIVPDLVKWPDFLGGAYSRAIAKAQNEALIAPAFGDMPTALGAYKPLTLYYQFSSFSYTVSNVMLRKLIQNTRLHYGDETIRVMAPYIVGIGLGIMVMYLKNKLIYGKSEEEIWGRPMPELVWDVFSRTPFVAGQSSAFAEAAFQTVGSGINNAVGRRVVPQAANFFKQRQGVYGVFGPAAGMVAGTYASMLSQAANGQGEKALERLMKQQPIVNTTIVRSLINLTSGDD